MTYEPRVCAGCGGAGGHAETVLTDDGGQITIFRTCAGCSGTGVR